MPYEVKKEKIDLKTQKIKIICKQTNKKTPRHMLWRNYSAAEPKSHRGEVIRPPSQFENNSSFCFQTN